MSEAGTVSISPQPLGLEPIPGQIGTAIIRPIPVSKTQNESIYETPLCTGEMTTKDADIMYSILLEIGAILSKPNMSLATESFLQCGKDEVVENDKKEEESLKKFTVSFPTIQYTCSISNSGIIYIVKKRSI